MPDVRQPSRGFRCRCHRKCRNDRISAGDACRRRSRSDRRMSTGDRTAPRRPGEAIDVERDGRTGYKVATPFGTFRACFQFLQFGAISTCEEPMPGTSYHVPISVELFPRCCDRLPNNGRPYFFPVFIRKPRRRDGFFRRDRQRVGSVAQIRVGIRRGALSLDFPVVSRTARPFPENPLRRMLGHDSLMRSQK